MSEPQVVSLPPHAEAVWAIIQPRDLTDAAVEEMQRDVLAAAAQKPKLPVILDLTKVEFVPSMGLAALVSMMRSLKKDDHRFVLASVHPHVRNLLSVTRLDRLFEIHANLDAALKHIRGGS
jgi:anti-sigma B factor antagonist